MAKEEDDKIQKFRQLRIDLTNQFLKVIPKRLSNYHCYGCGKGGGVGTAWVWHWCGFTFHKYCLPER